jgi:pimeloyl-ACP methyl ester carboxylesterase
MVLAGVLNDDEASVDPRTRMMRRMIMSAGNDVALVARQTGASRSAITDEQLAAVGCPVLVVLGERDFAAPATRLVAALPDARLVTLPGVDHFATASDVGCIDAVLDFLSG